MCRKVLTFSNTAHRQILQKYGFPCTLWAVLGSHGIAVKYTATIFFPTEDSFRLTRVKYRPTGILQQMSCMTSSYVEQYPHHMVECIIGGKYLLICVM